MPSKTCIIITGPTAVGKTSMAVEVADHFSTDIISADSRQCYKELNIGVAKPSAEQLQKVHHYFINSHSVHEEVTAASFEKYALEAVNSIFQDHDMAVMVGGTGLYIKAFCEGMDPIPDIDITIRNSVIQSFEKNGLDWLREQIRLHDPLFFEQGEIDNPQRMMRALEVKLGTGQSIRQFQKGSKATRDFNIIKIALELPREQLYKQINRRVDIMMEEGLLEEVRQLYSLRSLNALQTVGYSELFENIDGMISLPDAIEAIKINTRHYAKRQITWFKKTGADAVYAPTDTDAVINFVANQLQAL